MENDQGSGSGDSAQGIILEALLYSTSTTSSSPVIAELEAVSSTASASLSSTAATFASAASSTATSSEEISSTLSSLLEEDGESFLVANISSTISSLTSLEEDSDEIFAEKIAGDFDVTSPLRVPKYFQAIITLFTCAVLLICTIGIIKQVRLWCFKSSCHAAKIPLIKVNSSQDGSEDDDLNTVLVENGGEKERRAEPKKPGDRHFDYYSSNQAKDAPTNGNGSNGASQDNDDLLKPKKVRFVRRVSGPFTDEAMDFAGATYKTDKEDGKYLSKEKSRSSKKVQPQIKFNRKASHPTIPPSALPQPPPPPPPVPLRSSSPPPPPPPRSSPPPL